MTGQDYRLAAKIVADTEIPRVKQIVYNAFVLLFRNYANFNELKFKEACLK